MRGHYAELLLLLGVLLLCSATSIGFALNLRDSEVIRCIDEERQALLKFKQGLQDHYGMLSSWGNHEEDCCNWKGIKCSNRTGHVVKLHLRGSVTYYFVDPSELYLSGEISSSILGLQHLTFLDLSCNNFSILLPEFNIGPLTKLQYLNLSYNYISGTIPPQLGNLSNLISLDLSHNYELIEDHNLDWLFHLSSLRYLDMSSVNLSKVVNWLDKVNMLPSLLDLHLSHCQLSMPVPPVLSSANTSSPLSFLDLSQNQLNSPIFPWLLKYTNSLVHLDLHYNKLEGLIPKAFGNMVTLVDVDLSFNNLEGAIPQTLENLYNLQVLDLSNNNISGEVPDLSKFPLLRELHLSNNRLHGSLTKGMGKLSKLQVLDVSSNSLEGDITEEHLSNLSSLNQLDLSFNSLLILKFSPNWVPPFHLDTIRLSSCKIGPAFPQWLQTQNNFSLLEMSDVGISDTIPNWFWDLSTNIKVLNLSHNHINGTIPRSCFSARSIGMSVLDLSYNRLSGPLPQFCSNFFVVNLSNNLFQGSITSIWETNGSVNAYNLDFASLDLSNNLLSGELPNDWGHMMMYIMLNLANNNFSGRIPNSIFNSSFFGTLNLHNNSFIGELPKSLMNSSSLWLLDISNNLLSGELLNYWGNKNMFSMLNLANNDLFGRIPDFICGSRDQLETLQLHNNNFIGELPKSLMNCSSLKLLDLGENRLSGRIPTWIGTSLPHLMILRLPSNLFTGRIPLQLCHLASLQILDLFHNNITGIIPKCFNNLTGMTQTQSSNVSISYIERFYFDTNHVYFVYNIENLWVTLKEKYLEYSNTLGLVKVIDLSNNKLKGEIPSEITSLSGLIGLNLSWNLLTGIIPQNIGDMKRLESLDLSRNHLSGIIAPSLATISYLSYLNLSNNNLSGKIPTGTQLQSFNAYAYANNRDLCGLPLLKRCMGDETSQGPQTGSKHREGNIQEHTNFHEYLWLYANIALGFIVGFWGVCGSLLLKSSWRHAYFQYLNKIGDKFYVMIAIIVAKFMRNFKT